MKRFWIIFSVIAILGLSAGALGAAGYRLEWWTVDNGGGTSAGTGYTLSGTLGQPDAGAMSGGSYRLEGGFWGGALHGVSERKIFLPLLRK